MGEPATTWADNWEPQGAATSGGISTVIKVVHRENGTLGALKQLKGKFSSSRDRRFRMDREVNALRAVRDGVPGVIESNAGEWEGEVPLYAVLEWIDGPTLADAIGRGAFELDAALSMVRRLLETVGAMAHLEIVHRDIKPNNIVLRYGDPSDPVLLDFGLAWAESLESEQESFVTDLGTEIGNRFLRLPENAPGQESRDPRSDLTMVAGVLLFATTGHSPRHLRDSGNRSPESALADRIPASAKNDRRWPRLRHLFQRAFQPDLSLRFQSVAEFDSALANLEPAPSGGDDPVMKEFERLKEVLSSQQAEDWQRAQHSVSKIGSECFALMQSQASKLGFRTSGAPTFLTSAGEMQYKAQLALQLGGSALQIWAVIRIFMKQNSLRAVSSVTGSESLVIFEGPLWDTELLRESVILEVPAVLAKAIGAYTAALSSQID